MVVLLYPSNTFDLKDYCFMNVRHFPVGCTGGGGKLLKLQNDWQIINMFAGYDISLSHKYFSSLSLGDLPHSGLEVGKRDGREQSESAPGG